jgi:hypothetical protein
MYLGGTMQVIRRRIVGGVLAAVAASGLMFATSAPAAAHDEVRQHWHCLWTPEGWVPIAWGLSDHAPNHPALVNFHEHVHRGPGMEQLTIRAIFDKDDTCDDLDPPVAE